MFGTIRCEAVWVLYEAADGFLRQVADGSCVAFGQMWDCGPLMAALTCLVLP